MSAGPAGVVRAVPSTLKLGRSFRTVGGESVDLLLDWRVWRPLWDEFGYERRRGADCPVVGGDDGRSCRDSGGGIAPRGLLVPERLCKFRRIAGVSRLKS